MSFSKSALLSFLIELITRNIPAKRGRLDCLVVFFSIVLSSLPVHIKYDGANVQSSDQLRTPGAVNRNLPNLNETYGNAASDGRVWPGSVACRTRRSADRRTGEYCNNPSFRGAQAMWSEKF
jgi:hypothetical protein